MRRGPSMRGVKGSIPLPLGYVAAMFDPGSPELFKVADALALCPADADDPSHHFLPVVAACGFVWLMPEKWYLGLFREDEVDQILTVDNLTEMFVWHRDFHATYPNLPRHPWPYAVPDLS